MTQTRREMANSTWTNSSPHFKPTVTSFNLPCSRSWAQDRALSALSPPQKLQQRHRFWPET
uniref:Candidate secreted effector n=1 Tax=Meloidogyne incognita TaxID=6306 RepID=A0A914NUN5_MELIC